MQRRQTAPSTKKKNMKLTKLRAGKYLASFDINGVTELAIISQNSWNKDWEVDSCIGWNTDFSYGEYKSLREAKQSLAYDIECQTIADAGKTYGEPSDDHKEFVARMISI